MTVHDALSRLCCLLDPENHESHYDMFQWLYALSAREMVERYGPDYGSHPDLPEDIDKATRMTSKETFEFQDRLREILARQMGD